MLMNRKERLSGHAVKDKKIALLGSLRQCLHRPTVPLQIEQYRRRREIAVPQVVMHTLKIPQPFARLSIQRQQRIGVEVVARAVVAVEV